jgi:hypothetical protein
MIELEIQLPQAPRSLSMADIVEQVCITAGLQLSLKGTLAQYPGSVHWHFKQGGQRGTLELTWWEKENRLWFKVAAGRSAAWIDAELLADLSKQIQQAWLKAV